MFCAVLAIRSGSIGRFVPTLEHLGLGTLPPVLVLSLGVHHLEVILGRHDFRIIWASNHPDVLLNHVMADLMH